MTAVYFRAPQSTDHGVGCSTPPFMQAPRVQGLLAWGAVLPVSIFFLRGILRRMSGQNSLMTMVIVSRLTCVPQVLAKFRKVRSEATDSWGFEGVLMKALLGW